MKLRDEMAIRVVDNIMKAMVDEFNENKAFSPVVGIIEINADGAVKIGILESSKLFFQDGENGKRKLSEFVQAQLNKDDGPCGVLICHEAWVSILPVNSQLLANRPRPSQDPNRREAIVCSLIARGGKNYSNMLVIDDQTRQVTFEPYRPQENLWNRFGAGNQCDQEDCDDELATPSTPTFH